MTILTRLVPLALYVAFVTVSPVSLCVPAPTTSIKAPSHTSTMIKALEKNGTLYADTASRRTRKTTQDTVEEL